MALSETPLEEVAPEESEDDEEKENEYIKMLIRQETEEKFTEVDDKLKELKTQTQEIVENDK